MLSCAVRTRTPHEATIMGTDGYIRLHSSFWNGTKATLHRGADIAEIDEPYPGNGYNLEAAEVARCVRAGKLESDIIPHNESISIVGILDDIRSQWSLKYPTE